MPDHYQYTSAGYQVVDPDDAPTPEEQFCEYLAYIWEEASAQERIAIVHERYALGIRSKEIRELTATEQAVVDAEQAAALNEEARWVELDRQLSAQIDADVRAEYDNARKDAIDMEEFGQRQANGRLHRSGRTIPVLIASGEIAVMRLAEHGVESVTAGNTMGSRMSIDTAKLQGALIGLAVGDAVGTTWRTAGCT